MRETRKESLVEHSKILVRDAHHVNKPKPADTEKASDKMQHPFLITKFSKLEMEGNFVLHLQKNLHSE